MKLTRREMLQATAAVAASLPLAKIPVPRAAKPLFFTAGEFALVDELTEMIIPADAQSGGARAAGVATYVDARLAESFEPEPRTRWRAGLKGVDDLSRQLHGKTFMESTPEQRLATLTRMAATPQGFFGEIKGSTVQAYYSSKVGIHDDQQYKGNVYQTGEFAGSDPT